jgi:hypothetical protein
MINPKTVLYSNIFFVITCLGTAVWSSYVLSLDHSHWEHCDKLLVTNLIVTIVTGIYFVDIIMKIIKYKNDQYSELRGRNNRRSINCSWLCLSRSMFYLLFLVIHGYLGYQIYDMTDDCKQYYQNVKTNIWYMSLVQLSNCATIVILTLYLKFCHNDWDPMY